MTISAWLAYLGASVLLTIAPGPDNLMVIATGIARGRRAAIVLALGMCSGVSVHTTAVALGLSALIYSSTVAFEGVKLAGAAYLLWLAYKSIRNHSPMQSDLPEYAPEGVAWFRRGVIMNVLNPKVALFFLSFLPQFVDREQGNAGRQIFLLGLAFMAQAVVIFTALGYFAGSIGQWLRQRPGTSRILAWLAAVVFAVMGLKLALAGR
ncbi:MAG: LysE family translocator [Phycisphaeraceae bacterium]|nr:LysE family translocator [Phycisphaeraceae bacterium]